MVCWDVLEDFLVGRKAGEGGGRGGQGLAGGAGLQPPAPPATVHPSASAEVAQDSSSHQEKDLA